MNGIKHIIFDLDHTLWDFNRNSKETLDSLFSEFHIKHKLNTSFSKFIIEYYKVTNSLWDLYEKNHKK